MFIMLVAVIVFVVAIGIWKVMAIRKGMAMGAKFNVPAAVTTIVAKPQTWQPVLSAVGSLRAVNGVTVSTDLAGVVSQIAFESGRPVKKGELIAKLDTQQEEAQLHSAEAKRDLAKLDLERKRDLVQKKAISSSEFDTAESQYRQSQAALEDARALIGRKQIVAPFDGFLGIRQANVGQYLNAGAPIVPLQSLDPIYVEFALPQQHLEKIAVGKKLRLKATGTAGEEFDAEITAIDSKIDETTRNIMVQGTARNPKHSLRPGMFVNVEVLLPPEAGIIAIPTSAISFAPYSDSVFIVKDKKGPDGKMGKEVEQQVVKLGPTRGDQVQILSGVKAGDEVVSSGVFKLRAGAAVQINNSVQPGNELNPKPADT